MTNANTAGTGMLNIYLNDLQGIYFGSPFLYQPKFIKRKFQ